MPPVLRAHKARIDIACRRFGVERLELFGSATTKSFDENASDLDFLVTFNAESRKKAFDNYFGLLESLEEIFGRPVDLVTAASVRNPISSAKSRTSGSLSMPHRPEKLLSDVLAAAAAIRQFLQGNTRETYGNDLMLRSAVERQLEILGEAVRRLEALDPSLARRISEHRRVIAFRNIIAHGYDGLDDDIVWQIVTGKLPVSRRRHASFSTK